MKQAKHRLRLTVNDHPLGFKWIGTDDDYWQVVKDYHWAPEFVYSDGLGTAKLPSLYGHHSVARMNRRFFFDSFENRRSFETAYQLPAHVYLPGQKPRRLPKDPKKKPWVKDTWYHPVPEMRSCLSVDIKHIPRQGMTYDVEIIDPSWKAHVQAHPEDWKYGWRAVSAQLLYNSYLTMKQSFSVEGRDYPTADTSLRYLRKLNLRRGDDPAVRSMIQNDSEAIDRVYSDPADLLNPISGVPYHVSGEYYIAETNGSGDKVTFYQRPAFDVDTDYWLPYHSALSINFTLFYSRLSDDERQDLIDKAWQQLRPTLNGGAFNIVNFIIELKDFREIVKAFRNKTVMKQLKKFFYDKEVLTFKGLLHRVTTLHLQWKFAIAPLVSDLQEMYTRMTNMEMLISHYISNGDGQPHRRRKRMRLKDLREEGYALVPVPLRYTDGSSHGGMAVERFYIVREFTQRTVTVSVVYKYRARNLRDTADYIHARLDLLGASLNPATVWNAIPFSFVIDWGLRVGDYLEKFNLNWYRNASETLLDCCCTESYECSEEVYWIDPVLQTRVLVGSSTTSYYDRRKDYPSDRSPIRSEFTAGEIALGGSLAYQCGLVPFVDFKKKK